MEAYYGLSTNIMKIKVIAFDADDTLWVDDSYFKEFERQIGELLKEYITEYRFSIEINATDSKNLPIYGYGIKPYILSMIETALRVSNKKCDVDIIDKIILLGKEFLQKPIELVEGVENVLNTLQEQYKLVLVTKGELFDQEQKLSRSLIGHYFHHVEIMSNKNEANYNRLIKYLDIKPDQFLMIGDSFKFDAQPVLDIGGYSFLIPPLTQYKTDTFKHDFKHSKLKVFQNLQAVLPYLIKQSS